MACYYGCQGPVHSSHLRSSQFAHCNSNIKLLQAATQFQARWADYLLCKIESVSQPYALHVTQNASAFAMHCLPERCVFTLMKLRSMDNQTLSEAHGLCRDLLQCPKHIKDLMFACLDRDREKRPTISEIIDCIKFK